MGSFVGSQVEMSGARNVHVVHGFAAFDPSP
jgi:hypothetical protein